MVHTMRKSNLETLGLGTVLEIFKKGKLPISANDLIEAIFGKENNRFPMVISGANGIVGSGKTMQLASRLQPYGVSIIALDLAGSPDGIGKQFPGLVKAFGKDKANKIMDNVIRLNYDGVHLPELLIKMKPKFLLEAIPEILELKKSHYEIFRSYFPDIEIRSVTSGFPSSQLGVGIAHPSFPHEINKIYEIVEPQPSAITHLLWTLGLIPIPVEDHWSFVLDVLFCGLTLASLRYHRISNMPYWKIDKYTRKLLGPNPFRAHDAIGAQGANFLTWSCLHHLSKIYGEIFSPTPELIERKDSGENWYPPNHLRPIVDWPLSEAEEEELKICILGSLFQMTSLMLYEKRATLPFINAIGELCAQFRRGILAVIRSFGKEEVMRIVKEYHKLHSAAAEKSWYPDVFNDIEKAEWQQLYVNAEHDGDIGIISISRESFNNDVNEELNRAIDWLKDKGIKKIILTSDFHLSTQMIGADINEFFAALDNKNAGYEISMNWSKTARRLYNEFEISIGVINGKRCLGGFLELLAHCHYLLAVENAEIGMPEVSLPVVPGMEGCHWFFRKADPKDYHKILKLLLEGKTVQAKETVGWLIDYCGTMEEVLTMAWKIAKDEAPHIKRKKVNERPIEHIPIDIRDLMIGDSLTEAAREVIIKSIQDSCNASLQEALSIQANYSAEFMISNACRKGKIGIEKARQDVR